MSIHIDARHSTSVDGRVAHTCDARRGIFTGIIGIGQSFDQFDDGTGFDHLSSLDDDQLKVICVSRQRAA